MSEGYHPETDDSPLCTKDDSAKYRSIIGCCIWIIVLGIFDIAYATSAMSRINMVPREGHLKVVKKTLSYLKTFPKGRVIIETSYPDHYMFPVEDHSKIGWNSIQMLVKRFQRIFLMRRDQASG
jgi:hypothetical protein